MTLARYWHTESDGRVHCDLCPRACRIASGKRGFCFARQNTSGQLHTDYGRSSGFCIDPIEKKPLNHFAPGKSVFSFGTAGCNLACRYCQNWEISTAKATSALLDAASPTQIAAAATEHGCRAVAYTYNDPVIFPEYAIDVAKACHERGLANIAVSAGYINPVPRAELFGVMDAANIDLKAFGDDFYRKLTGARLAPVLDTLKYLVHETSVWVEITTLLIPDHNDSDTELHQLCEWVASELGPDVPLHFTAFHPDNRMRGVPRTPAATLRRARTIAQETGLHFVYTGNVIDATAATTYCPSCNAALIVRSGYDITSYRLTSDGHCPNCHSTIAGVWDERVGDFGSRRIPVRLQPRSTWRTIW